MSLFGVGAPPGRGLHTTPNACGVVIITVAWHTAPLRGAVAEGGEIRMLRALRSLRSLRALASGYPHPRPVGRRRRQWPTGTILTCLIAILTGVVAATPPTGTILTCSPPRPRRRTAKRYLVG